MDLTGIPRVRIGSLPTPLEPAADLGELLGIDPLWVKRDDLLGHSWGGNKIRPIEFLLGDALQQQADAVILCGGTTSNFAALMAVACARHGLQVHQVSYGHQPARPPAAMIVGARSGTLFHFTGSADRSTMEPAAQALADRLRAAGGSPYTLPRGGATPVGALGYANAAAELHGQLQRSGLASATVVVPVGSGGTFAGLVAGWNDLLRDRASTDVASVDVELLGISVSRPPEGLLPEIAAIGRAVAERCGRPAAVAAAGAPSPSPACRWRLVDGRGAGFGASDGADEALIAQIELRTRFLADPTYNGKALRWLRDAAADLRGPVVYWHTGGALGAADRLFNPGDAPSSPSTSRTRP